ncbi:hypothetical protein F3N42_08175 [Marinihelvus fidelis]|uniref:Uncharacterized protein n=1 Tax=Marinihelvus fidelis TaxID=2613842 RepID=A0A5N0TA14_9GAMM|nr:hypothetical protein [Marinihelvus fidelis]KAA9131294.1 hypothetical protein F3N42_08175 [Marinihelvus fidelis]
MTETIVTTALELLVILAGGLAATLLAGHLLGRFLKYLEQRTDALAESRSLAEGGLTNGGYWIGIGERSLIFLFIIIGEPTGIGFLAAAKSIFRIGEVKEPDQRRLAEYILIGTLMSFAAAIIVGLLTRWILVRVG